MRRGESTLEFKANVIFGELNLFYLISQIYIIQARFTVLFKQKQINVTILFCTFQTLLL